MTRINVLDSIMGSGKTTYVINMLNKAYEDDIRQSFIAGTHTSRKFLIVVPLLSEVDRIAKACPNLCFRSPIPVHGQKLYDLGRLIGDGENIVTTHSLFKLINRDIYSKLSDQGYTLIIDEALDCVGMFTDLTNNDKEVLFANQMVYVDLLTRRLCWNHVKYPWYSGKFDQIKYLCDTGSLVCIKDKVLIWEFPSEFLRCFTEVYVCTYLFKGSPFYSYLMAEGFNVTIKSVRDGEIAQVSTEADAVIRYKLRKLITLYDGSMNDLGKEASRSHPLSSSWYKRASDEQLTRIRSSTEAFFARHAKTPSDLNAWTAFSEKKTSSKARDTQRAGYPTTPRLLTTTRIKPLWPTCVTGFTIPYSRATSRLEGYPLMRTCTPCQH